MSEQAKCQHCGNLVQFRVSTEPGGKGLFVCSVCGVSSANLADVTGKSYRAEQMIQRIGQSRRAAPNANVVKVSPTAYATLMEYAKQKNTKLHELVGLAVRVDGQLTSDSLFTFMNVAGLKGFVAPTPIPEELPETAEVDPREEALLRQMAGEPSMGPQRIAPPSSPPKPTPPPHIPVQVLPPPVSIQSSATDVKLDKLSNDVQGLTHAIGQLVVLLSNQQPR